MPGRDIPLYRPCGDPALIPDNSGDEGFTPAPVQASPPVLIDLSAIRLEPLVIPDGDKPVYYVNTEQSYTASCPGGPAPGSEPGPEPEPEPEPVVCNEAFNELTWTLDQGPCGPTGFSGSGTGANASLTVGPNAWACPRLFSSSVFIAGVVDCFITVSGFHTGGTLGSAKLFVNGVVVKQYDPSNPIGTNEPIHIFGVDKNWQFRLDGNCPGVPYPVRAGISVFLGEII